MYWDEMIYFGAKVKEVEYFFLIVIWMDHFNTPVVIDNGTGSIKAGFAGDEVPRTVFTNFIGRPKYKRYLKNIKSPSIEGVQEKEGEKGEYCYGKKAEQLRGILRLKYPMDRGVVADWNDMERIWSHLLEDETELGLRNKEQEHPVLITECPLNPRKNRERMTEYFFEECKVPAFFVSVQPILSLYSSGVQTGVVLDSGEGTTTVVATFECYAIPSAVTRIDVAGKDVTSNLQLLLRKSGYIFHTSAEREVVRSIKESSCYVARSFDQEEGMEKKNEIDEKEFKLPDGKVIKITGEQYRAPEILFKPYLIGSEYMGVHEALNNTIQATDLDIRQQLYSSIYLAGGSTLFDGFGDRLVLEMRKLAPKDMKIKIAAPPERKYSAWIGGSILASLSSFSEMWVTLKEYEEEGHSALHKKCF